MSEVQLSPTREDQGAPSEKSMRSHAGRWLDPLALTEQRGPGNTHRVVLWTVCLLVLTAFVWAMVGKLDIIVGADGRLAPQTLLKIVQPAEAGVVRELLVSEGQAVRAGELLARLDATVAGAESRGVASDLARQRMQERRIRAALADQPMLAVAHDDVVLFEQVRRQYAAQRQSYLDSLAQEQAQLQRAEHEQLGARALLAKIEQSQPDYRKSAESYRKLADEGFFSPLAATEKEREARDKVRELEVQRAALAAAQAAVQAQLRRLVQLQSSFRSELERELAEVTARIAQLQPALDKTVYREGLLELRAPQDGLIKDVASTTPGAVVQPGSVLMTLVPAAEQLYADVAIRNADIGFVRTGQRAQIKLAAYPFQKYGLLGGEIVRVSPDASDPQGERGGGEGAAERTAIYRARIRLDEQSPRDTQGRLLKLASGMQVTAEIHQGERTVMQYVLSPVQKAVQEAARER